MGGGKLIFINIYRNKITKSNETKGIAIVAICKNESSYILEWIAFHQIIGINHIFIYDNGSTDDTVMKIRKYFNDDFVTIIDFPGEKQQLPAYNDALMRFGNRFKYMAFIDCDEFIMPKTKGTNIEYYFDSIIKSNAEIGGICLNWCMFGSSGLLHMTKDLLLEKFLHRGDFTRAKGNACIKSIVMPSKVKTFKHAHYPCFKPGYYGANLKGDIVCGWRSEPLNQPAICINHYFTKSLDEWIERRKLGKADVGCQDKRSIDEFYQHDDNSIYDPSTLMYINEIKTIIEDPIS